MLLHPSFPPSSGVSQPRGRDGGFGVPTPARSPGDAGAGTRRMDQTLTNVATCSPTRREGGLARGPGESPRRFRGRPARRPARRPAAAPRDGPRPPGGRRATHCKLHTPQQQKNVVGKNRCQKLLAAAGQARTESGGEGGRCWRTVRLGLRSETAGQQSEVLGSRTARRSSPSTPPAPLAARPKAGRDCDVLAGAFSRRGAPHVSAARSVRRGVPRGGPRCRGASPPGSRSALSNRGAGTV